MAGLGVICLFVIVSGLIGIIYTNTINTKVTTVTKITAPAVENINTLIITLWKSNNLAQKYAREGNQNELQAYAYEFNDLQKEFESSFTKLKELINDKIILENIRKASSIQTDAYSTAKNLMVVQQQFLDAETTEEKLDLKNAKTNLAEKVEINTEEATTILEEVALKLDQLNKIADAASLRTVKKTRVILVITTVMSIIAAVLIWIYLSQTMVRPIKNLTVATGKIASGNFDIKIKVTESDDEFNGLTKTFNQMAKSLKNMIEESPRMKRFLDIQAVQARQSLENIFESKRSYIIAEMPPNKAYEVVSELNNKGKKILWITRTSPDVLKEKYGLEEVKFVVLSESKDKKYMTTSSPDVLLRGIKGFCEKHNEGIIVIERLDYLIMKYGFPKVLNLVVGMNDVLRESNLFSLIPFDINMLNTNDRSLLENECEVSHRIEGTRQKDMSFPEELRLILLFIYDEQKLGKRVTFKDVGKKFNITAPTTQKKVKEMELRGLIRVIKQGRNKIIDLTIEGKNLVK